MKSLCQCSPYGWSRALWSFALTKKRLKVFVAFVCH